MSSYTATVERDGRYRMITVGAVQTRRLGELEGMTTDLIEVVTDDPQPEVEYDYRLPEAAAAHVRAAHERRRQAAEAQSEAAAEIRAAADLHDQGISLRDIGRLLGVPIDAHTNCSADRPRP